MYSHDSQHDPAYSQCHCYHPQVDSKAGGLLLEQTANPFPMMTDRDPRVCTEDSLDLAQNQDIYMELHEIN